MKHLKIFEQFSINEGTLSANEISEIKKSLSIELSLIMDLSELEEHGIDEVKTLDDAINVANSDEVPKEIAKPTKEQMTPEEAKSYNTIKDALNADCYCSSTMTRKEKRKTLKEALKKLVDMKKGLKPKDQVNEQGLLGALGASTLSFYAIGLLIILIFILLVKLILAIKSRRQDDWCNKRRWRDPSW